MNKLPDDVLIIISSYYGNKISNELSREINDQQLLYAIKENEYYNKKFRTWHISKFAEVLMKEHSVPDNLKKIYYKSLWKDTDDIINKMWKKLSSDERKILVEKNFPYAFTYKSKFITFNEFFYDNFGYYIN